MLKTCNFTDLTRRELPKLGTVILAIAAGMITLPTHLVQAIESEAILAKSSQDLPVVESANLDTDLDVPWSQPVKIQDPFEGEMVGIFDRHYFYNQILNTEARVEVVSLWSPDSIHFLLAYEDRDCGIGFSFYPHPFNSDCLVSNAALKITDAYLKIDEEVFRLEGKNSRFAVDKKLANALKNSPPGNVDIRLIVENGEAVDSKIGEETVEAWKAIY